jgi:D-glycero-D-manno-heptose 1,7-bisphosphate phosphatase
MREITSAGQTTEQAAEQFPRRVANGGARRAVFLDRDGVLNQNTVHNGRPYAPKRTEDFVLLPKVGEAVRQLRAAGFVIIVATNQPDVGAGLQTRETVDSMHERLRREVLVDDIRVCFHVDKDNCDCRKPKPGLLLDAAKAHAIELSQSWMIGDRWRDVSAGQAAGCRTVFIDYDYAEPRPNRPDVIVRSLVEAVPFVISSSM